jgi:peptide deformylase
MGIRNILKKGDSGLEKKSREVKDFNQRLHTLLDDMRETLIEAHGLGLAAPQVGVLRRAVLVVDTSGEEEKIIEMVNPEIMEADGEQEGPEGCLSVPNVWGIVKRPMHVKVRAQDRFGNTFEAESEGITARAFCHEIDHLNGTLFVDISEKILSAEELEQMFTEANETEEADETAETENGAVSN